MMSAALKSNGCEVIPFHVLELPTKKVGHPYVADVVISESESSGDNSTISDDALSASVVTVHRDRSLIMVIEVKKSISAKFFMSEPSDVIELLIYCKYLLTLHKQKSVLSVLTDGFSWHCMSLKLADNGCMRILKYCNFTSTDELLIIGTIPALLEM